MTSTMAEGDQPHAATSADDIRSIDDLGLNCECKSKVKQDIGITLTIRHVLARLSPDERQTLRERLMKVGVPIPFYDPLTKLGGEGKRGGHLFGIVWVHPCDVWLEFKVSLVDVGDAELLLDRMITISFASVLDAPVYTGGDLMGRVTSLDSERYRDVDSEVHQGMQELLWRYVLKSR